MYYGKLKYVRDLVLYESDEANGLKAAFEGAVDDYLALCEAEGIEPNKPLKGCFSVAQNVNCTIAPWPARNVRASI